MNSFALKIGTFEGPLELLLELIEKRKLLINDVSLASVADEYMDYISRHEENPIRETAQFVLVASTLLLIKSKSLLPVLELTDEETASVDDLERRLKLYQIFRNAGRHVEETFGKTVLHERKYIPNETPLFKPDMYVNEHSLYEAIREVLKNLPKKIFKPEIAVKKMISLEDMIDRLHKRIENGIKLSFKDFTGNSKEKVDVVVSFLAVLELVKQGLVAVRQGERFSDFNIEREHVDTPKYRV